MVPPLNDPQHRGSRLLRWSRNAVLTLIGIVLLLFGTHRLARSRSFQLFGELVRRVETAKPMVALTFDDGPTLALTDSLIAILDRAGARATFFVMGRELAVDPTMGTRLLAAGHELGNHTYNHRRMILRSPRYTRDEIEMTDSLIREAGQKGPIYFRPPYTWKLISLPLYLARTGRVTITTDIEPESYPEDSGSTADIVNHVLRRARPGSIILLHPWYSSRAASLEAIPLLIDSLHARGYQVTTVRDLLQN